MKLKNITEITGKIILKSGLHIGGGDTEMRIGGTDNTVVKHPHTQEPYIPGSSIKGKVRSLLEMRSGLMKMTEGAPLSVNELNKLKKMKDTGDEIKECRAILRLFGASAADDRKISGEKKSKTDDLDLELGPTRVSFADCMIDEDWKNEREKNPDEILTLFEVKSENTINRITGTAQNPRFIERVPEGVEFKFCVSLKKMDIDKDDELQTLLLIGLKLLEKDALGGNGSRGYGRIEFGGKVKVMMNGIKDEECFLQC